MSPSFGKCTLLIIEGIESFASYFQISCFQTGAVPFEIKGAFVRDSEPDLKNLHDSPKIEHLPLSNKKKPNTAYKKEVKVCN